MHSRMSPWARAARHEHCCEPRFHPYPVEHARHYARHPDEGFGGGAFGVRRPLRFLAWKLQLDETQVGAFAAILNELKTERAQAAVDDRRALSAFADSIAGESFDAAKAEQAQHLRVQSAERLQGLIATSLGRMHALLEPEQRERLAYLIRTGTLLI
ncbi:MAG TPA: Spy/CpxP family protein refolding chaperone [Candidatus Limnocylindria bacterium]|nr:Spy/CpxP family protein refolding chaperone [Candidatus Limnocylindria bacterium]